MKKEPAIALFSANIGQGNPLATSTMEAELRASGLPTKLQIASNPLTWLVNRKQAQMTGDEFRRIQYNQNYEQTRGGWQAKLLGLVNLLQLSVFLRRSRANTLVLTQELPLTALDFFKSAAVAAILAQIREVILLVPDAYAKNSAAAIAKRLQARDINLRLAVWNQPAAKRLEQNHVAHHLIRPWLIPNQARPISPHLAPISTIRPSGTGLNPAYLQALPALLEQQQPHRIGHHLLGENSLTYFDKNGQTIAVHQRLFTSLQAALISVLRSNPEIIISYPSEMVQVITQFLQSGWKGRYLMLPQRGLHEIDNSLFATSHGLGQQLRFENNQLAIMEQCEAFTPKLTPELVGQRSLAQILVKN